MIESKELKEACRLSKEFFIRDRVFTFCILVTFIVNFIKKSLQIEVNNFMGILHMPNVSKQAFSQARRKLSPQVFRLLNNKLITEFYSDNEFKTFKGRRVFSVDGSTIHVPDTAEIRAAYGTFNNDTNTIPGAKASFLFDVYNGLTFHSILAPYQTSEKDMVFEHIQDLLKIDKDTNNTNIAKDIIMFDRGYPSACMFFYLSHAKKDFIFRCPSAFIAEVNEAVRNGITFGTRSSGRNRPRRCD